MWIRRSSSLRWALLLIALVGIIYPCLGEDTLKSTKPKVFGVGLSKTGTTSLGKALEDLDYANVHSDRWLVPFIYSDDRANNFTERYDDVDSVEDIPTAYYFKQLYVAYPEAKFVLTTRDVDDWYKAFLLHDNRMRLRWGGSYPFRVSKMLETVYGSSVPQETLWKSKFLEHMKKVRETIPSDQLLELNVFQGEGWDKLCPFLGQTSGPCSPDSVSSSKFPHLNVHVDEETNYKVCKQTEGDKKNAVVSLLSQPSVPEHRDFLLSFLVQRESLRRVGSTAEVVVLVYGYLSPQDEQLLFSQEVKVIRASKFGKVVGDELPEEYAEAQLVKLRVFELVEYRRVLFLDADVIIHQNIDHLFELPDTFLATGGSISPLNGGFFLATPDCQSFTDLLDISTSMAFTPESGWFEYGAIPSWKNQKPQNKLSDLVKDVHSLKGVIQSLKAQKEEQDVSDWSFYGAHVDQGLLYYYFYCYHKSGTLLPPRSLDSLYTHFTGLNKPFLLTNRTAEEVPERYRKGFSLWFELFEEVKARVESQTDLPQLILSGNSAPLNATDPYEANPDLAVRARVRNLPRRTQKQQKIAKSFIQKQNNPWTKLRQRIQLLCLNENLNETQDVCVSKTLGLVRQALNSNDKETSPESN